MNKKEIQLFLQDYLTCWTNPLRNQNYILKEIYCQTYKNKKAKDLGNIIFWKEKEKDGIMITPKIVYEDFEDKKRYINSASVDLIGDALKFMQSKYKGELNAIPKKIEIDGRKFTAFHIEDGAEFYEIIVNLE